MHMSTPCISTGVLKNTKFGDPYSNVSLVMNFFLVIFLLVNYYLVTFGIVTHRQTDRLTDRKPCIRAHCALAQVG